MEYKYDTTEEHALKALKKYNVTEDGQVYHGEKRITQYKNHGGYSLVTTYVDGKQRNYRVHRLVALKYLGASNGLAVNHKDGDKNNNHRDNLEYCTLKENLRHYWSKGEHHSRIKLTPEIVKKMREEYKSGRMTIKKIAKDLGLNYSYASQVIRGLHWKQT